MRTAQQRARIRFTAAVQSASRWIGKRGAICINARAIVIASHWDAHRIIRQHDGKNDNIRIVRQGEAFDRPGLIQGKQITVHGHIQGLVPAGIQVPVGHGYQRELAGVGLGIRPVAKALRERRGGIVGIGYGECLRGLAALHARGQHLQRVEPASRQRNGLARAINHIRSI